MFVLSLLLSMVLGLLMVAFSTLLERKLLGTSQIRLGPNKVSLSGILQPVSDGVKLLAKNCLLLLTSSMLMVLGPLLLLVLFLIVWSLILPWSGSNSTQKLTILFMFIILGVSAYSVILTGWSSFSSFSKLGSLRGILQSLSFEATLIIVLLLSLSFYKEFGILGDKSVPLEFMFCWLLLWSMVCLMESNRAPFDLLEGESELISGFNVELSSVIFVFLFLSEYGVIVSLSLLGSLVIFKSAFLGILLSSALLFVRSCYPRIRYDSMMTLMWKEALPWVSVVYMLTLVVC